MSGSRVPDELSPVKRLIPRIEKKQRIIRTRRGIYEQELKAAEASMGAAGEAVKKEWRMVGLQCVESLRTRYREAAALKAAYVEYSLWTWQFPYVEDRRDFPVPRHCPVVCDVGQFRGPELFAPPHFFPGARAGDWSSYQFHHSSARFFALARSCRKRCIRHDAIRGKSGARYARGRYWGDRRPKGGQRWRD